MTITALLANSARVNNLTAAEHAQTLLLQLCERLPITVIADMVAHTIATDEEGESEATSDFLYQVGKLRCAHIGQEETVTPGISFAWGSKTAWEDALESAKARYDTGYIPN